MNAETEAKARRAVAAHGFRWKPQMVAASKRDDGTWRRLRLEDDFDDDFDKMRWVPTPNNVPDLDDLVTRSLFLPMAREHWDNEFLHVTPDTVLGPSGGEEDDSIIVWSVSTGCPCVGADGKRIQEASEIEALIAALECGKEEEKHESVR